MNKQRQQRPSMTPTNARVTAQYCDMQQFKLKWIYLYDCIWYRVANFSCKI